VIWDEATFNRALGQRVRAARKRRGLTQRGFADRLQVGRTSIVLIERGDQRVPSHLLVNMSEVLGLGVVELLGISDEVLTPGATLPSVGSPAVDAWLRDTLTKRSVEGASDGESPSPAGD
jgi:transcriptional regulator with XRE-family HTH domain